MKNIHIVPTDKPSRLHLAYDKNYYLSVEPFIQLDTKNYKSFNIYITSDEEIKEGDWILNPTNEVQNCIGLEKGIGTDNICWVKVKETTTLQQILNSQKIILTTDQDLIKNGVQAIDDDFLEWFVKNPSCEEVKVENEKYILQHLFKAQEYKFRYKIIIPKEDNLV